MSEKLSRWHREEGFTIVEMAAAVVILGIIIIVVTVNYASTRANVTLKSGADEVESAIKRCYTIASQEGVDVYLQFWDEIGDHPKHYAIYRVYAPEGLDEKTDDLPTETPAAGSGYTTDGSDHYWFKLAEGRCWASADITLLFQRQGTNVAISVVEGGPDMQITVLVAQGDSRTVWFNEKGELLDGDPDPE
jgi:type II secretory pathway pseudopilin PulG